MTNEINKPRVWSHEKQTTLFTLLVEQFGPHSTWNGCVPAAGKEALEAWCATATELFGATGDTAVKWRIEHACKNCNDIAPHHFADVMIARTDAVRAGFITRAQMLNGVS